MFTPQEIQERTGSLEKAVFGGYSMSSVEDLLTPLTEDFTTLYKENAVLKSKMKVLVDRLEEYRKQEETMNRALLSAQKTADEVTSEAERKCAKMIAETEQRLRQRSADLQKEIQAESERVTLAKKAAAAFIVEIEDRVSAQLSQLEQIKQVDLTIRETAQSARQERKTAAQKPSPKTPNRSPDLQRQMPAEKPRPAAEKIVAAQPKELSDDEVARQIEENLNKILAGTDDKQPKTDAMGDTRVLTPLS